MIITKRDIQTVRSLQQKKYRDETRLFVAEGRKLVEDLRQYFELEMLLTADNCTPLQLEQASAQKSPQGYIGVFRQREQTSLPSAQTELVLALDDVQDPGNLGTIIRTADWFGVKKIVCSRATADMYNPKVVQSTMGALGRVRLCYTDLAEWLKQQRCEIYGTVLDGKNIYEQTLSNRGVIIMGNEGNGISDKVRRYITAPLLIPSFPAGEPTSESLNVAVATAVTLALFRR